MHKSLLAFFFVLVVGVSGGSDARAQALVAERDYYTASGGKVPRGYEDKVLVEVYFSYLCYRCRDVQPQLSEWLKKLPSDVEVAYVPLIEALKDRSGKRYRADHYVRAYYAAQHLGITEESHQAVYDGVHRSRVLPGPNDDPDLATIAAFYSAYGADSKEFLDVMRGPEVEDKVRFSKRRKRQSAIRGLPAIVVDGSYGVNARGGDYATMLRTASYLVEEQRKITPSSAAYAPPRAPVAEETVAVKTDRKAPAANDDKIVVRAFFDYRDHRSLEFEPLLSAWAGKQPEDVVVVQMPLPGTACLERYARAYYAAQYLGYAARTHRAVYDAVHKTGALLGPDSCPDRKRLIAFYGSQGVDVTELAKAWDSFRVETQVYRAQRQFRRIRAPSLPVLIVNDQPPAYTETARYGDLLNSADDLIERERRSGASSRE